MLYTVSSMEGVEKREFDLQIGTKHAIFRTAQEEKTFKNLSKLKVDVLKAMLYL